MKITKGFTWARERGGLLRGAGLAFLAACSSAAPKTSLRDEVPADFRVETAFEARATTEPFPGLKLSRFRHRKSGLDVLFVPKPGTGVVATVVAYRVGSRFERPGRTGLAHLFEHMMFRGTESFPEPFKTLSGWGDRFNAYTSDDLTLYHELVTTDVFPEALRFEAERMRKLLITPEGFNTERGAVVSERKMRTEDSPMGRGFWELNQLAFDVHPYKTSPIGWQEDLEATSFQDALDFYKRYYAPNRASLVIVGDVELRTALALVEKNFGAFEPVAFQEPKIPAEPPRKKAKRRVITMKTESVLFGDMAEGPTYASRDAAARSLSMVLFGESKLGYLVGRLVDTGLAKVVGADASPSMDPHLQGIYMQGNPGVPLAKLEAAYEDAKRGFLPWLTAERLERIKLYYLASQYEGLRDPMSLASDLGRALATTEDPAWDFKSLEAIKAVTLPEVRAAWNAWVAAVKVQIAVVPGDVPTPFGRAPKVAAPTTKSKGARR